MPNSRSMAWRTSGVVLACVLVLAGCGAGPEPADPDDPRPVVLATFTVIADMAREVGGDRVRVESITRPGAEIHDYEPVPGDLVRGADADLVLDNGLGLERWFEQFVDRSEARSATVSDGVDVLPIAAGEYRDRPNPHAWMSPVAGERYVANIRDALVELDPAGRDVYTANAAGYAERIRQVGEELRADLGRLPDAQRVLVTCEGAFSYLARDMGLRESYLWPVNSDAEGTPDQIASTIAVVRDDAVPAVFCESTVNDSAQRQVAAETGARLAGPLYVDSLSEEGGPVPSYLDLLRHDARVISDGLTGAQP
ncbi:iron-binding protein [Pseudonocardia sp. EC080610-09]|uniref:metal ABC transporter substrate-binding protein n=1 Tax=Pseudonocardia sp. EC080625-04 TaxID=1096868 RepID=UPI0006CB0587|nr:metal ABC transporter substrate-binding protein [Pseudonocardia sp. EC080625-04]ALE76646.1 iron-binding protein [Pseudonocardia sp. EC080625-04]ALL78337.1 iron-binding protein [Pseudonocardia sp. EC080610-09]ALL84537.1 iron-binding protein [Pseudonocardia sp. EC080619-01]